MDDFYEALDRFKWVVLLLSPLLVVLASAGGYWLSRRALAPVDQITRAAQELSHSTGLADRPFRTRLGKALRSRACPLGTERGNSSVCEALSHPAIGSELT